MFETSARGQLKMIWWGRSIAFRLSRQASNLCIKLSILSISYLSNTFNFINVSSGLIGPVHTWCYLHWWLASFHIICFIMKYNHILSTRKMTNYLCSVEQCGIELKQPWSCPTAEVFAWLHMYWTNRELRMDSDLMLEHRIWEVMSKWISEAYVFGRVANMCFWEGTCLWSCRTGTLVYSFFMFLHHGAIS